MNVNVARPVESRLSGSKIGGNLAAFPARGAVAYVSPPCGERAGVLFPDHLAGQAV